VEGCYVSVGDNSVAIKSGIDYAGRTFGRPSYNIVMRDSTFVSETWASKFELPRVLHVRCTCTFAVCIAGHHHAAPSSKLAACAKGSVFRFATCHLSVYSVLITC